MARKRNHELTIGEIVFDDQHHLFGVITSIDAEKGIYTLDMTKKDPEHPDFDCKEENQDYFEFWIHDDIWTCEEANQLYQINWKVVDCRWNKAVCYEHQKTMDNYPFYSPYLEENLFNIEVEKA